MSSAVEVALRLAEERARIIAEAELVTAAACARHQAKRDSLIQLALQTLKDFAELPDFTYYRGILSKKNIPVAELTVQFDRKDGFHIAWVTRDDVKQISYEAEDFNNRFGQAMVRYL